MDTAADQQRLQAQSQLLDSLRSPRLLLLEPTRPDHLSEALESGERFEWLVSRAPFQGLAPALWHQWLEELDRLASPRAQWRLLLSGPLLGPAGALAELLTRPGGSGAPLADTTLPELLHRVSLEEEAWLTPAPGSAELTAALEALHWQVELESWQESLTLELCETTCQRWFGPGAAYRSRLETVIHAAEITRVEAGFRGQLRALLPQRLRHQRLVARRSKSQPTEPPAKAGP